jgi:hypothetical protein
MKANIGKTDRILRLLLGVAIILAGILYNSWLILVGGIVLLTSFFSWCPVYVPFGWDTRSKAKDS